MRYQLGHDGEPLKCTKCGEWLRSSPVFDTFPVCARPTCRNAENSGARRDVERLRFTESGRRCHRRRAAKHGSWRGAADRGRGFAMMIVDVTEAFAGLNGWHRWNAWAAHYFVDGAQLCNTNHSYAAGGMARGLPPVRPKPVDLSTHGAPFGRVCSRCLKLSRQRARSAGARPMSDVREPPVMETELTRIDPAIDDPFPEAVLPSPAVMAASLRSYAKDAAFFSKAGAWQLEAGSPRGRRTVCAVLPRTHSRNHRTSAQRGEGRCPVNSRKTPSV